jgi:hypothetical protein
MASADHWKGIVMSEDRLVQAVYTYFSDAVGEKPNLRGWSVDVALTHLGFDQRHGDYVTPYGVFPVYRSGRGEYEGFYALVATGQYIMLVDDYDKIERFVSFMAKFFDTKLVDGDG